MTTSRIGKTVQIRKEHKLKWKTVSSEPENLSEDTKINENNDEHGIGTSQVPRSERVGYQLQPDALASLKAVDADQQDQHQMEPRNAKEAIEGVDKDFRSFALAEEITSVNKRHAWDIVSQPEHQKPLNTRGNHRDD
ncbi:hypothetical protein NDN08_000179 [Rhodosorus marinus]|uniref:Ribosome biogenesis protein NOP53 n=1 Tax=Rhodosorus marinus TaxID=101924 RepID=A0AAV8UEG3_9RHOD|nr:hypothetical protein NDN08_000179 [Rhodosorus marinus]